MYIVNLRFFLVKQAPKDPREQLLANTHQHSLATTSHGTHRNHLVVSSIDPLKSLHPLVNPSLTESCIYLDGMKNDVSLECCITKVNKTICFMYIVNLRFFGEASTQRP
jgi:hypothetical protein